MNDDVYLFDGDETRILEAGDMSDHLRIIEGPIRALAYLYGVTLQKFDQYASLDEEEWSPGPMGDWLNLKARSVGYSKGSKAEGVLHELVHVVLGPESIDFDGCEGYVLFPVEWEMVRWVRRRVARFDEALSKSFVLRAMAYQNGTSILTGCTYLWDVGGRSGPFWKQAYRRAVAVKLLTEKGRLTYSPPEWGSIPPLPPKSWFDEWSK